MPVLTLTDKLDIKEIAARYKFDYIVVPSVQTGRDVQEIKLFLQDEMPFIKVVAKIDSLEAVQNYENILKQADGVVILRKELFELEPEKVMLA